MTLDSSTLGQMQLDKVELEVPLIRLIKLAGENSHFYPYFMGERVKRTDHFGCRVFMPTASGSDLILTFAVRLVPAETTLEVKNGGVTYTVHVTERTDEYLKPTNISDGQLTLLRKALIYLVRGARVNLHAEKF